MLAALALQGPMAARILRAVSDADIDIMMRKNPARLLGLGN
jgi:hypothetical protein